MTAPVLAVANAKGGTGKTTTAVHLAAGAALAEGLRTVLVDLDPQGNATSWMLGELPRVPGAAEALLGEAVAPLEVPNRPGLAVVPSTPALARADLALAGEVGAETLLSKALAELGAGLVIIDCPPSLGLTVLGALVAAHGVVVPVLPGYMSLEGLARLGSTMDRIRERLGRGGRLLGWLPFAVDRREAVARESRELLEAEDPRLVYRAEVRLSTAAKTLPAHGLTAFDRGADARGAEDWPAVLTETLDRLTSNPKSKQRRRTHG